MSDEPVEALRAAFQEMIGLNRLMAEEMGRLRARIETLEREMKVEQGKQGFDWRYLER